MNVFDNVVIFLVFFFFLTKIVFHINITKANISNNEYIQRGPWSSPPGISTRTDVTLKLENKAQPTDPLYPALLQLHPTSCNRGVSVYCVSKIRSGVCISFHKFRL